MNELDYNSIICKCGYGELPTQTVIKNIAGLEEFYNSQELVEIYNYALKNIKNAEIIIEIIKLSDIYKSESTLNILLNLLMVQSIEDNDEDTMVNLRSMCARAISNYKDYSTVSTLLSCLNNKNEDYKVRLACADALGRIGDKYAVQPLINLVSDENEKSVYLKETAT
ncbi:MAG: HEAT repeat domain-containing protein, partial [bacterium]|nr:HEAT repeat domain-containing protein [bacterium]